MIRISVFCVCVLALMTVTPVSQAQGVSKELSIPVADFRDKVADCLSLVCHDNHLQLIQEMTSIQAPLLNKLTEAREAAVCVLMVDPKAEGMWIEKQDLEDLITILTDSLNQLIERVSKYLSDQSASPPEEDGDVSHRD